MPESVDREHPEQPYEATTFTSSGHYGSTVYDPMSKYRHLRIIICDKCLLQHKAQVQEVFVRPRSSFYDYQPWDPGPGEEDSDVETERPHEAALREA